MPRDSSGVYTLPIGNPVVTNTIIASGWANDTMGDIAAQLNNVLTRDGLLGPVGPFRIADGTVAAPGLAFAAETQLGWYREGTGKMSFASAGAKQLGVDLTAAGAPLLSFRPRALGSTAITLQDSPDDANRHVLVLQVTATGHYLSENIFGTSVAQKLNLGFPAGITSTATDFSIANGMGFSAVNPNFAIVGLGNGLSGAYAFLWDRNTARLTWTNSGGGGLFSVEANGITTITTTAPNGGLVVTNQGNTMSMWMAPGAANYFSMAQVMGSAWAWQWNATNGALAWLGASSNGLFQFNGDGNANKSSGAGQWGALSDERIKERIEDYTTGLDAVLALRPRTFYYREGMERVTDKQQVGMIAQEVEQVMPEMVTSGPVKLGENEFEDLRNFDPTNIQYALINATKELHERIAYLEAHARAT